jgi:hypothetical protein
MEAALLAWIAKASKLPCTITPVVGAPRTCYKHPLTGVFSHELLLPNFADGEQTATTVLETHMAEMRKPITNWFAVTRLDDDTGALEVDEGDVTGNAEEEGAEEEAEASAGEEEG